MVWSHAWHMHEMMGYKVFQMEWPPPESYKLRATPKMESLQKKLSNTISINGKLKGGKACASPNEWSRSRTAREIADAKTEGKIANAS